jgi:UDP-N-acetylglucosamine 4-epimerase
MLNPNINNFSASNNNSKPKSILVTGGAGFIGSNLVEALLKREDVALVRVLDNFATGHKKNIEEFFLHPKFELIDGDIRNIDDCMKACKGIASGIRVCTS